jgi:hypothetical protein
VAAASKYPVELKERAVAMVRELEGELGFGAWGDRPGRWPVGQWPCFKPIGLRHAGLVAARVDLLPG